MTRTAVPEPEELIALIQRELCNAVRHPKVSDRKKGRVITPRIKRPLWEKGFCYRGVYPRANGLGEEGPIAAQDALVNTGASAWLTDTRKRDHSVLKEYQFDVSWTEYASEYGEGSGNKLDVPPLRRVLLAFETELGNRPAVVYDFDKLLAARAAVRALLWDSRDRAGKYPEGHEELADRLRNAEGGCEGWWLLSGWGDYGLDHRVYHDGERQRDLERGCDN